MGINISYERTDSSSESESEDEKTQEEKEFDELSEAAQSGNIDKIKEMVKNGRPLNYENRFGDSALHLACRHGHLETVKFLVKNGSYIYYMASKSYKTHLHYATENGHLKIVEFLLNDEADANAPLEGDELKFEELAREAAFLLNGAITRAARGHKTFGQK